MSKKFHCPHCGGNLNPNNKIIHVAKNSKGQTGLVLQNETFGEYTYITDSSFRLEPQEKLTHYCPLCQKELTSQEHPNCSELIVFKGARKGKLLFANNAGVQSTCIQWENGEKQLFGKDRDSVFPGYPIHEMNHEDHKSASRM
jgi:hypothetical protein